MDNKQEVKAGSRLKERDKQIVIIILLAVALVGIYLFTNNVLSKKTETLEKENVKLGKKVKDLEDANAKRGEIEKDLKKKKNENKEILGKYPTTTTIEKAIETFVKLLDKYTFGVGSIGYKPDGVYYTFVDENGKEDGTIGAINSTTLTIAYNGDYPVLKKMIDYINLESPTKLMIQNIAISTNEQTGGLSGNMTIKVFTGHDTKEYEEPKFKINKGRDSLFFIY